MLDSQPGRSQVLGRRYRIIGESVRLSGRIDGSRWLGAPGSALSVESRRTAAINTKTGEGTTWKSSDEMLMTEKGPHRKGSNVESDLEHSETGNSVLPLNELLVNSTVPAAAVAVKLCEDSADEASRSHAEKQRRGILSNFQRRTFSRISFKGETGPLLSRCIYFSFFFPSSVPLPSFPQSFEAEFRDTARPRIR